MTGKTKDSALNDILADINKDSRPGSVQFLKDGDTTIKLVLPEGRTDIRGFYERFYRTFPNQKTKEPEQFPYFLVAAVIVDADSDEGGADRTRIRYVQVTKTVLMDIVNLLSKKWQLFEDGGSCIVVTRGKGKGGKVEYRTVATPETFEHGSLPYPSESIEDAAAAQETNSLEYAAASVVGTGNGRDRVEDLL